MTNKFLALGTLQELHRMFKQSACWSAHCRYSKPFQAHQGFLGQACEFNLVVFATFPELHLDLVQQAVQKGCSGQRFLLVVHNPHELGNLGERPSLFAWMTRMEEVPMAA